MWLLPADVAWWVARAGCSRLCQLRTRERSSFCRICSSMCSHCNICACSSNFFSATPSSQCDRWPAGLACWVALGMLPDSAVRTRESAARDACAPHDAHIIAELPRGTQKGYVWLGQWAAAGPRPAERCGVLGRTGKAGLLTLWQLATHSECERSVRECLVLASGPARDCPRRSSSRKLELATLNLRSAAPIPREWACFRTSAAAEFEKARTRTEIFPRDCPAKGATLNQRS